MPSSIPVNETCFFNKTILETRITVNKNVKRVLLNNNVYVYLYVYSKKEARRISVCYKFV